MTISLGYSLKAMLLVSFCTAIGLLAGGAALAAPEEAEVMLPIQRFFEAFARRDRAGMMAETVSQAALMSEREGALHPLSLEALADRILTVQPSAAIAETIHDPVIHVDKTLAAVWAPYRFTIDGKPNHCGVDAITLLRLNGRWLIVGIADNSGDCS
jgi:hypothetical protein